MRQDQHDRDAWIEQPLREMLQAQTAAEPTAACLDAETLAAWADGALAAAERSAAEAHASECARCQALLAAMARTTPPPPVRAWRSLRVMGWLVPITATAAAAVIWLNVGGKSVQPSRVTVVGPASPASTVAAAPAAAAAPRDEFKQDGARMQEKTAAPARESKALGQVAANEEGRKEKDQGRAIDRLRAEPARNAFADARRKDEAAPPPPPPPAPAPATPPLPAPVNVTGASPVLQPPPAQAVAETVAADAMAKRNAAAAGAPAASPRPALERQADAAANAPKLTSSEFSARGAVAGLASANARQRVIEAANSRTRWLIAPSGAVQRSTDDGVNWETQQTGVPVTLTSGSAPSALVCWLVGPGGTVVLTTDGHTWRRIAFPEAVDLVSIIALSDRIATVTTANGRTFNTVDAGAKWTLSRP